MFRWCRCSPVRPDADARPHLPPDAVDRAPAPSTRPTPSLRASQMFWKTSNVSALTEHLKVSGTCSAGATRLRLPPDARPQPPGGPPIRPPIRPALRPSFRTR
ncbi:hypothetical protein [Rothia nasimurium]|uniref:hypothetical protein n=1 Tax=Rothia nasimurium TaxID=85336 RepID=UPI001F339689|nr:hypothetical protein [Rothia nasimurium]